MATWRPGSNDVCPPVNDGTVDPEPTCTMAVVYDTSACFATGGGWIDSPAGVTKPDGNEGAIGKDIMEMFNDMPPVRVLMFQKHAWDEYPEDMMAGLLEQLHTS
jgi:hypothetical protein